jgi:hypothetical protein
MLMCSAAAAFMAVAGLAAFPSQAQEPNASFDPSSGPNSASRISSDSPRSMPPKHAIRPRLQGRSFSPQVVKYKLVRPSPQATNMLVKPLGTVLSVAGAQPSVVGGD